MASFVDKLQELENLQSTRTTLKDLGASIQAIDAEIKELCAEIAGGAGEATEAAGEFKQQNNDTDNNNGNDSDSDNNDALSRAVALSLDTNNRADAFVVRCLLDGCIAKCPIDSRTGGSHDFCCIEHTQRAAALASRKCGLPGCNNHANLPADYCSQDHQNRAAQRGLLPPHEPGNNSNRTITIDIMLDRPGVDFQGGHFQTLQMNNELHRHSFEQGDALVFVSHKYHCVAPVTAGLRRVLVTELWGRQGRRCAHRCECLKYRCPEEILGDGGRDGAECVAEKQKVPLPFRLASAGDWQGGGKDGSGRACHRLLWQSNEGGGEGEVEEVDPREGVVLLAAEDAAWDVFGVSSEEEEDE